MSKLNLKEIRNQSKYQSFETIMNLMGQAVVEHYNIMLLM